MASFIRPLLSVAELSDSDIGEIVCRMITLTGSEKETLSCRLARLSTNDLEQDATTCDFEKLD